MDDALVGEQLFERDVEVAHARKAIFGRERKHAARAEHKPGKARLAVEVAYGQIVTLAQTDRLTHHQIVEIVDVVRDREAAGFLDRVEVLASDDLAAEQQRVDERTQPEHQAANAAAEDAEGQLAIDIDIVAVDLDGMVIVVGSDVLVELAFFFEFRIGFVVLGDRHFHLMRGYVAARILFSVSAELCYFHYILSIICCQGKISAAFFIGQLLKNMYDMPRVRRHLIRKKAPPSSGRGSEGAMCQSNTLTL